MYADANATYIRDATTQDDLFAEFSRSVDPA
jgi:hypothetical protein